MKFIKVIILTCGIVLNFTKILAQESTYYTEDNEALKRGLNLVDQKLYAPAQKEFKELKKEFSKATDNHEYTVLMFADFYYAFCAAKLNEKDAELLITRFIEAYHETTLRNKAYFELGSYYFRQNKSSNAIEWYEKVDTKELTNIELIEYKFNFGYMYFKKKKFDDAKPLFKSIKDAKHQYAEPATYYYGFISFYEENYKEAEKSFEKLKDSKLYKNAVPYYLTQIYFLRKNYQKVIDYAAPLISQARTENIEEIAHIVGQAYFELNDYENAAPLIEAYVNYASKVSKEELYQLAYAQYKTNNFIDALENFQELNIIEDSLGQNAMYCLADCYLKTNNKAKAKDAFQQAAALNYDPFIKEISSFQNAKLAYELNYTNQAIVNLTNFLENYPNSPYTSEAGDILSQALLETKNFGKAVEVLENYQINGPSVDKVYQQVSYYRAVELFNDKNYDEALLLCNKSLKKPLDKKINALALFLKGNILFEQGDYGAAAANYTKFSQFNISSSDEKYATKALANYNIAYCNFKEKNYATATTYFEKTIRNSNTLNSTNKRIIPDAFLRNADCLFMEKNYDRAIFHYDEVINNDWQGAEYALVQKSVINGLQGNFTDKINTLEFLNKKYKNNIYKDYALYEIGNAYIAQNNYTKAIQTHNELTKTYPTSTFVPYAYLKLGLTYFNTQQENKALTSYKKVVIDYPNTEQAKEALVALKELYVYLGQPNEYLNFVQNQAGIDLTAAEQDALVFESAESQYMSGNCNKAIPALSEYIKIFPTGNSILDAYFFRADCLFKGKDYDNALLDYLQVVSYGTSKHQEDALLKATYISYEIHQDYEGAKQLYTELNNVASIQSNQEIALIGLMRCNFQLKQYDEVINYAENVLTNNSINDEVKTEATFYLAKAQLAKQNYNEAQSAFEHIVNTVTISSIKAESAYSLAYILHKKYLFEASNEACFSIKNEYASYEYWVVKTFILIADNYVMLDNVFQAKATLQSIVDNYTGDEALLQEATEKLNQIKIEELENTKIDLNTNEGDTIEFDNIK